MLLADSGNRRLKARLEGSRSHKTIDFVVELPTLPSGEKCVMSLTPVRLPAPKGLVDRAIWKKVRRGWFGALQPSAQWGEQSRPFGAPAGILANNVISDPASCSLWFYADQALWTPQFTTDISVAALVRGSIDWWLDHRTRPTGEVVCYWDYGNFLDANTGPLIAAWDYVEATGDEPWLKRHIDRLELIAEFLANRDVDGDGLVEATQSGNRGTLKQPARSCAWFDALNCGHKDGYTNALIYRAWRCLAELEGRLDRSEGQARYCRLADRLKAAYVKTLYNPATGWLAWWKAPMANCTITPRRLSTVWPSSTVWWSQGKVVRSSPGSGPRSTRSVSIASIWGFRRCSSLSGEAITCSLTAWGFRSEKTARTPSATTRTAA